MSSNSVLPNDSIIGTSIEQTFHYTWRDVILYNLSVGAEASDLPYVYEKELRVIPTFAVVPCTAAFGIEPDLGHADMPSNHLEGLTTEGTIHLDQKLIIRKPLPTEGTWKIRKVLSDLFDRGPGRGAKITETVTGYDDKGEELFVNEVGTLKQWGGGFGGKPVPKPSSRIPDREPDHRIRGVFPANAAALYRLTGDLNDIHVSPEAARAAHLKQPILHGLCSMGYACRILVDTLLPGEPERVRSMENQFRAMVLPGEAFALQIWTESAGRACYRLTAENDGRPIIDNGVFTWE